MNLRQNRLVIVLLAVGVLVGVANVATYAGTGDPLLLGRTNTSTRTSTIVNTRGGPVLELEAEPGAAPLAVSSAVKVRKLNADKLDGYTARQLQTRSIVYTIPALGAEDRFTLRLPGLHRRVYQASFSVVAHMFTEGATINCYFAGEAGWYELLAYGSTNADYSTSNASGVLDLRDGPASFDCFTHGGLGIVDADRSGQSQIVLTPIDRIGTAATTEVPRMRSRRGPGVG